MFTGGSGGSGGSSASSVSLNFPKPILIKSNKKQGGGQNAFIGMAMGQASKLFEQQSAQGNVASGASKESAIQQAGEMALKVCTSCPCKDYGN